MKDYFAQYKDPRWQKKRLEILKRDGFKCRRCGDTKSELQVHHKAYFKNRDLWDYDNHIFMTLCDKCHREIHDSNYGERSTSAILMLNFSEMGLSRFELLCKKLASFSREKFDEILTEFYRKIDENDKWMG